MKVMDQKAKEAQICYEALLKETGVEVNETVGFYVGKGRKGSMLRACFRHNPFPKVRIVLCFLRLKAVVRLFKKENVVQTGPAAAVLALDTALAGKIADIRKGVDHKYKNRVPIICDVAFAGLSVIRLYMMGYSGNEKFRHVRCDSGMRVNNALNGSFYKYKTKDDRFFSAHVYYESQKAKMMKALRMRNCEENIRSSSFFT